jgi:hypothetical protein
MHYKSGQATEEAPGRTRLEQASNGLFPESEIIYDDDDDNCIKKNL